MVPEKISGPSAPPLRDVMTLLGIIVQAGLQNGGSHCALGGERNVLCSGIALSVATFRLVWQGLAVLYYVLIVLLYYSIFILLYYCITALRYYCIIVLLYCSITVLL